MARAGRKTGAKAMVRAAGTSGETSRGRAAGTSSILMNGIAAGRAASRSAPHSFETGDDAAEQIVAVERVDVGRMARCDQLKGGNEVSEAVLLRAAAYFRGFDGDCDEA